MDDKSLNKRTRSGGLRDIVDGRLFEKGDRMVEFKCRDCGTEMIGVKRRSDPSPDPVLCPTCRGDITNDNDMDPDETAPGA